MKNLRYKLVANGAVIRNSDNKEIYLSKITDEFKTLKEAEMFMQMCLDDGYKNIEIIDQAKKK